MVKVLIVDDSSFMRSSIQRMLEKDPKIEIVGTAKNGLEGLEQAEKLQPDIITLDVEMPVCDGLTMLQKLMETNPTPVIMVSTLTSEGADATLKALDYGALDFMPKYKDSTSSINDLEEDLCTKIHLLSRRKPYMVKRRPAYQPTSTALTTASSSTSTLSKPSTPSVVSSSARTNEVAPAILKMPLGKPRRHLIGIGVSTGGPPVVQKILTAFPKDFPGCIFIAQHMPASFTGPFAQRLDGLCEINVQEAVTGAPITMGTAYICPGGQHLRIDPQGPLPSITITPDPVTAFYKPSADVLFESLANFSSHALGVMLTGMGNDGCQGMTIFHQKGGKTIAQNEETCVVYGMPKAVVDANVVDHCIGVDEIAQKIIDTMYT